MIDLKVDLSYLSRYYGEQIVAPLMPVQYKEQNNVGETGELLTIVTQDGQITVNAGLLHKLLLEPEKLAKVMRLQDPNNRYLIIQQLNEEDLEDLLPFLSSEQLSYGLQYFNVEGLNALMIQLPKEEMVNLLLQKFTMEDVVPFMETNEMDRFFQSTNLEKRDIMEYLKGLDHDKFQELMMNQFGSEFENKTSDEYLEHIDNMEDDQFKRFLQDLQTKEKMDMIVGLCNINPDYYLEFDNDVLARPIFQNLEKMDIIKMMSQLDEEFLIPMIEQLPKELTQVVATQIDAGDFAKMLSGNFPDLLMKMLAGK